MPGRRLSSWLLLFLIPLAAESRAGSVSIPPDSVAGGALTLRAALQLALARNPELAAAGLRREAAEGRRQDAGRRLNPLVAGSVENFGGSLGDGQRETSVTLEQTIELGGDRGARTRLAQAEVDQAGAARARRERDALAETSEQFLDAWLLQERVRSLSRGERLAQEAIAAAAERYRAGAAPVVERMRAEGVRTLRATERRRARAEFEAARQRLALSWGGSEATFDSLALGDPTPGPVPPAAPTFEPAELQAVVAERAIADGRVRLARAARVPDLTINGGVRRLEEAPGTGFVASVGLPLPLWNRQSGTLAAAETDLRAARLEEQATSLRLQTELRLSERRLASAAASYDTLRAQLVPSAEQTLELVRGGYRAGRFGYLELFDAQRAVLEAQLAVDEAKADLWRARLEYARLAGRPLEPVGAPAEER